LNPISCGVFQQPASAETRRWSRDWRNPSRLVHFPRREREIRTVPAALLFFLLKNENEERPTTRSVQDYAVFRWPLIRRLFTVAAGSNRRYRRCLRSTWRARRGRRLWSDQRRSFPNLLLHWQL